MEVSAVDDKGKVKEDKDNKENNNNYEDVKATFRIKGKLFWGLKRLAVDKRTNMTVLANEAFHDLLTKHQKKKEKEKKGSNL